jgi:hypothetical protein
MTRYPRSGKGRRWTILELKAIPPDWKGDTIADGDGLVGEVRVARDNSVSLAFRCAFKWEGKLKWHYCGTADGTLGTHRYGNGGMVCTSGQHQDEASLDGSVVSICLGPVQGVACADQ